MLLLVLVYLSNTVSGAAGILSIASVKAFSLPGFVLEMVREDKIKFGFAKFITGILISCNVFCWPTGSAKRNVLVNLLKFGKEALLEIKSIFLHRGAILSIPS